MARLRHLVLRSLFRTELQQRWPAPAPVDDRQPTAPAGLPGLQFFPRELSAVDRPLTVTCLEAFAFGLGGKRPSSLPLHGSQRLLSLTDQVWNQPSVPRSRPILGAYWSKKILDMSSRRLRTSALSNTDLR